MKGRLLIAALSLGLLGLAAFSRVQLNSTQPPEVLFDAPAFRLVDDQERTISSSELRGTVVVANFIYTSCTDICPLLSMRMAQLQARLHQEGLLGPRVKLLSFSVDPVHDTPGVLRAYAQRHQAGADWRFLTGSKEEVVPLIVEGFHLGVQALRRADEADSSDDPIGPTQVMHSGRFVLIDRDWRIRRYYDGQNLDFERVVTEIRRIL